MTQRVIRWLSVVFLLLIYVFTRLHNLMALPLFVDESVYIYRAQLIREGHVLRAAQHSRTLHAWMTAVLGPNPPVGGWLARVAIVLLGLLGAAAFYALVRGFVSHRAGLLALVVWIAAPYALFYERLALADPALAALAVVAVWVAWRMAQTGAHWVAVLLGLSLTGLLLAKASGTSWLPLPVVALVLATGVSWRRRFELAALAYSVFGVTFGAFYLVVRARGRNYFDIAERFVGDVDGNIFDRIQRNIGDVWDFDVAYLSVPLIVVAVLGALVWLWHNPRAALFGIAALGMGGGGAIVFGRNVNSRYALNHVAWVVLLGVVGVGLLIERYPRWRFVVWGAVVAWIAVFAAPFALDAWNDPADLPLFGNDRNEYVSQESSGFGLAAIGEALSDMPGESDEPLRALGLVANCEALRVYAHPVEVTCPTIYWDSDNAPLMAQSEVWAAEGSFYVVGENLPYIDLSTLPEPHTLIMTVERPGDFRPVHLYRIEQGALRPVSSTK